eukprot:1449143-Amphidinium_carterae.1
MHESKGAFSWSLAGQSLLATVLWAWPTPSATSPVTAAKLKNPLFCSRQKPPRRQPLRPA